MMKSLFAGVAGLKVHQVKMDNIANNIANVNTTGYKKSRINFEEMITQVKKDASGPSEGKGGTNALAVGLGVQIGSQDVIVEQGNLQVSNRNTDVAIQGNGYFSVMDQSGVYYTRNGNFSIDAQGNLVNSAGLFVLGKMTDGNGDIGSMYPMEKIQIPMGQSIEPKATTSITFENNLDSSAAIGDSFRTSLEVYDIFGTDHVVEAQYTKTAIGEWDVTYSLSGNDPLVSDWLAANVPGFDALDATAQAVEIENANAAIFLGAPFSRTSHIVFQADGSLDADATRLANGVAAPDTLNRFSFDIPGGTPVEIGTNISRLTQYSSLTTVMATNQNGNPTGLLKSLNFNESGDIYGVFSNGFNKKLGVLGVTTFPNPEGLKREGGSLFSSTSNSGEPSVGRAGDADKGDIAVGYLEMSNVDLSEELTSMITTQRGFQVNSKAITTSDEMLQELVNLKR